MELQRIIEIESRVVQTIKDATKRANEQRLKDRAWTDKIREAVTTLGSGLGYKVRGVLTKDRADFFEAGWLWDLTWVDIQNATRSDRSDGNLIELPLILESEWNTNLENEILWDFQKLLVGKGECQSNGFPSGKSRKSRSLFQQACGRSPSIFRDTKWGQIFDGLLALWRGSRGFEN